MRNPSNYTFEKLPDDNNPIPEGHGYLREHGEETRYVVRRKAENARDTLPIGYVVKNVYSNVGERGGNLTGWRAFRLSGHEVFDAPWDGGREDHAKALDAAVAKDEERSSVLYNNIDHRDETMELVERIEQIISDGGFKGRFAQQGFKSLLEAKRALNSAASSFADGAAFEA